MSVGSLVEFERKGTLVEVCLNRPNRANAYNKQMLDEFETVLTSLEGKRDCSVLLLSAKGTSFCAGADLDEMKQRSAESALFLRSQHLFQRFARLPIVTLAAINGPAIAGGFELALACDLRIASNSARFQLPETSFGIIPAAGGTQRLKAIVGVGRAKEMILARRVLSAQDALNWGVVSRLAPGEDLMTEARLWCEDINKGDHLAQVLAKDAIDLGEGSAGLRMETLSQAFLQARKAQD